MYLKKKRILSGKHRNGDRTIILHQIKLQNKSFFQKHAK